MSVLTHVQPEGWPRPKGYANGMLATGGQRLYVAGQIAWDETETIVSDEFLVQFEQALANVVSVLKAGGAEPADVASMTIYVTDIDGYRTSARHLGPIWRRQFGKNFPAMALVGVAALVEPRALVEIQAIAELSPASNP